MLIQHCHIVAGSSDTSGCLVIGWVLGIESLVHRERGIWDGSWGMNRSLKDIIEEEGYFKERESACADLEITVVW